MATAFYAEFGRRHSNFARTSGGRRRARPASTHTILTLARTSSSACRKTRCSSVSEAPPSSRIHGFDGQQVVHRRGLLKVDVHRPDDEKNRRAGGARQQRALIKPERERNISVRARSMKRK